MNMTTLAKVNLKVLLTLFSILYWATIRFSFYLSSSSLSESEPPLNSDSSSSFSWLFSADAFTSSFYSGSVVTGSGWFLPSSGSSFLTTSCLVLIFSNYLSRLSAELSEALSSTCGLPLGGIGSSSLKSPSESESWWGYSSSFYFLWDCWGSGSTSCSLFLPRSFWGDSSAGFFSSSCLIGGADGIGGIRPGGAM